MRKKRRRPRSLNWQWKRLSQIEILILTFLNPFQLSTLSKIANPAIKSIKFPTTQHSFSIESEWVVFKVRPQKSTSSVILLPLKVIVVGIDPCNIQIPDGPGVDPTDVRRQEHDGCLWPQAWALPHRGLCVQGEDVDEGGGRATPQHTEQEQLLLRWVDPQQREDRCVRHPSQGSQDGGHLYRQLHGNPGIVQEDLRAVHRHVQKEGLPPLVHWRGYGRDGVHRYFHSASLLYSHLQCAFIFQRPSPTWTTLSPSTSSTKRRPRRMRASSMRRRKRRPRSLSPSAFTELEICQ